MKQDLPACDRCEDCGRNVPWTDEDAKHRPDTCKLKQIDLGSLAAGRA